MSVEERRKFHNPTESFVGAVIYDDDGKRRGVPVEPRGYIWLSEREERATAEAPVRAQDNPFVREWDEIVERTPEGEPLRTERRSGMLVLADPEARPIGSERFTPSEALRQGREDEHAPHLTSEGAEAPDEREETVTGAPPQPRTEPEVGTPSEDEVVATPEAVPANDREKEARARDEGPTPVTESPKGTEEIGTPPTHHPMPV